MIKIFFTSLFSPSNNDRQSDRCLSHSDFLLHDGLGIGVQTGDGDLAIDDLALFLSKLHQLRQLGRVSYIAVGPKAILSASASVISAKRKKPFQKRRREAAARIT
jgi:hypothetical protein